MWYPKFLGGHPLEGPLGYTEVVVVILRRVPCVHRSRPWFAPPLVGPEGIEIKMTMRADPKGG